VKNTFGAPTSGFWLRRCWLIPCSTFPGCVHLNHGEGTPFTNSTMFGRIARPSRHSTGNSEVM